VDAVHRLLPKFSLLLFGVELPQQGGTFQGGLLSPLLCVLFLIDLTLYFNGAQGSAFRGVPVPWNPTVVQAAIKLLLFTDDVVVLASSIPQLQEALNLIWNWVHRRLMKLSIPKCDAARLARSPKDKVCNDDLPSVHIGTHPVPWVTEKKYLGFLLMAAADPGHKQVRKLTGPLYPTFRCSGRYPRLASVATVQGVHQVIHFNFLHPTCLVGTDYRVIDTQVSRCLKTPLVSPTVRLLPCWPLIWVSGPRSFTRTNGPSSFYGTCASITGLGKSLLP